MRQYSTMRTECLSHEKLRRAWSAFLEACWHCDKTDDAFEKSKQLKSMFQNDERAFMQLMFQLCYRSYATETDGKTFFDLLNRKFHDSNAGMTKNKTDAKIALHFSYGSARETRYVPIYNFLCCAVKVLAKKKWRESITQLSELPSCLHYIASPASAQLRASLFPRLVVDSLSPRELSNSMINAVLSLESYTRFRNKKTKYFRKRKNPIDQQRHVDSIEMLTPARTARAAALYTACYHYAGQLDSGAFEGAAKLDRYSIAMVLYDRARMWLLLKTEDALANLADDARHAVQEISRALVDASNTASVPMKEMLSFFQPLKEVIRLYQARPLDYSQNVYVERCEVLPYSESVVPSAYPGAREQLASFAQRMTKPVLVRFAPDIDALRLAKTYIELIDGERAVSPDRSRPVWIREYGTLLLLEADEHTFITRHLLPALCCNTSAARRNNTSIMYPIIANGYIGETASSDSDALYYAMRMFYSLLTSRKGMALQMLPSRDNTFDVDSLQLHRHRLLRILDKFDWTREDIWSMLSLPFCGRDSAGIHRGYIYGACLHRALASILEFSAAHSIEYDALRSIIAYFEQHHGECSSDFLDMLYAIQYRAICKATANKIELEWSETRRLYRFASSSRTSAAVSRLIFFGVFSNDGQPSVPGKFAHDSVFGKLVREQDIAGETYAQHCEYERGAELPSLERGEQALVWILQALEDLKHFVNSARRAPLHPEPTLPDIDARFLKLSRDAIRFPISFRHSAQGLRVLHEDQVFPTYTSDLRASDSTEERVPFPNPPPGFLESIFLCPL